MSDMKHIKDIRALIITRWSGSKCKFAPGDKVRTRDGIYANMRANQNSHKGEVGKVVARTNYKRHCSLLKCMDGSFVRFLGQGCINRYYVQFKNKDIIPYDSPWLERA